jgi:exopolysaccharide production protein ExoY
MPPDNMHVGAGTRLSTKHPVALRVQLPHLRREPDCDLNWQIQKFHEPGVGRDRGIARCSVYEYGAKSFSASARDGADVRAPLGGIRKRAFDITISSIALIVLAPILLATAGLVRSLVRKSIFVTDECIGFGGKPFVRYQFASLVDERADTSSALLRLNAPSWAESLEEALRASGVNKLPLLFNMLRGDMTLIGSRPITVRQLSHYNGLVPVYLLARPGITGLWRRRRKKRASGLALDRYYIRYWSVWLDLALLVEAISNVG